MNRYLYVMFLYAFSPIFLSTNLSAAEWACAVATGPNTGRYAIGETPANQEQPSRDAAIADAAAKCPDYATASGVPNDCRVLGCWVRLGPGAALRDHVIFC